MIQEFLSKLQPGDIIPVLAIAITFGTGIVIAVTAIIVGNIRRCREREMAIGLIQELVERGLPTDEIERLIDSSDLLVTGKGKRFSRLLSVIERKLAGSCEPRR
jgi:hypothetical protein